MSDAKVKNKVADVIVAPAGIPAIATTFRCAK